VCWAREAPSGCYCRLVSQRLGPIRNPSREKDARAGERACGLRTRLLAFAMWVGGMAVVAVDFRHAQVAIAAVPCARRDGGKGTRRQLERFTFRTGIAYALGLRRQRGLGFRRRRSRQRLWRCRRSDGLPRCGHGRLGSFLRLGFRASAAACRQSDSHQPYPRTKESSVAHKVTVSSATTVTAGIPWVQAERWSLDRTSCSVASAVVDSIARTSEF
jgi:hypothetical protein